MREILFRGKRLDNGEWVEGYLYITHNGEHEIGGYNADTNIERWTFVVDPASVGQYTGLTDKNGKRIFEGDIVRVLGNQFIDDWKNVDYTALIAYLDGGFCAIDGTIEDHGFRRYTLCRMDFSLEVVGTVHDNPELLEGGGE